MDLGLVWSVLGAVGSFIAAMAVAQYRLGKVEKRMDEAMTEQKAAEEKAQKLRHDLRDHMGARINVLESNYHELSLKLAEEYHNKDDLRTLLAEMLQPIREAQNQQNAKLERLLERTRST